MQSRQLIIGQKYKKILDNSEYLDGRIVWLPDNPYIDERICGHADMSVFEHNGSLYVLKYYKDYVNTSNCIYIDEFLDKKYPNDVKFNACSIGNYVFLNEKYVSHEILNDLKDKGSSILHVNQGYCNCSILVLNDDSLITSDEGIYKVAKQAGLNVLKIQPGFIDLPGFSYGLIGGSGFLINDKTLAFTGLLNTHPDRQLITQFCANINIDIVYLTENTIFDIGGAIKAE